MGRLSLNPIAHIDPLGTIIVPLVLLISSHGRIGYGWAKPVPVNPANFDNPRRGILLVSLAGPVSNILLATVCGLLLRFSGFSSGPIAQILVSLTILNLYLAFFNLIPVPPFDGSGVVASLLPPNLAYRYESAGRFGIILVFILIITGLVRLFAGVPAMALFLLLTGQSY